MRCSNATLPYAEVRRFPRVARWVYKAPWPYLTGGVSEIVFVSICAHGLQIVHVSSRSKKNSLQFVPAWATQAENCTVVTSNLRLVSKKSRSWLQRSHAQLQRIPWKTLQRWAEWGRLIAAISFQLSNENLVDISDTYSCKIPHSCSISLLQLLVTGLPRATENPLAALEVKVPPLQIRHWGNVSRIAWKLVQRVPGRLRWLAEPARRVSWKSLWPTFPGGFLVIFKNKLPECQHSQNGVCIGNQVHFAAYGSTSLKPHLHFHSKLWRRLFHFFPKQLLGFGHSAFACFVGPVCCRLSWFLQSGYRSQWEDRLGSKRFHSRHSVRSFAAEVEVQYNFGGWGPSPVATQTAEREGTVSIFCYAGTTRWDRFSVHDGQGHWRWSLVWLWHHRAGSDCTSCICVLGGLVGEASWTFQKGACVLQHCSWSQAVSDGTGGIRVRCLAHQRKDRTEREDACDGWVYGKSEETCSRSCHGGGVGRRHQYSKCRHMHVCGTSKQLQEHHSSDRAYLAAPPIQTTGAHCIASCCCAGRRTSSCPGGSKFSRVKAADKELQGAIVEPKGTGTMLGDRASRLPQWPKAQGRYFVAWKSWNQGSCQNATEHSSSWWWL